MGENNMFNEKILELKRITNVNIGTAKNALVKSNYDMDKAILLIREEGLKIAHQRRYKLTKFSTIGAYLHSNQKIAALVEIACESESTSNSDYFKTFANNLAKQIVSSKCIFISKDDIPLENIEKIKTDIEDGNVNDCSLIDDLDFYFQENCLLSQKYIMNENITIDELIVEFIYTHQENVEIKKFVRYEV